MFKYRAKTAGGDIVSDIREDQSEESALTWLRSQGMTPISVEASAAAAVMTSKGRSSLFQKELIARKIKIKDKVVFFKQMATMVNAGVTVAASVELLSRQSDNKTLARTLSSMKDMVGGGVTMAGAMGRFPKVFSHLEIALVRAGEEGGVLDVCLTRLAAFVEGQYTLQKKIKGAMIYPMAIISVTILALAALCIFIVPIFREAFANIGLTKLPALTEAIFAFSDFLRTWWFTFPIPFILIWYAIKYIQKTPGGKRFFDARRLKYPIFGDIIFKAALSRAFRTFATLLAAGVSVLDSLEMASGVSDNVIIADAFSVMRLRAQNGVPLSTSAADQHLFPLMISHMLSVGEETGAIDEVMAKIADWYDMELDEKIKALTSIMEPLIIILIGGVVGLIVSAVFIPLVQSLQEFM
ncbi:secretion system protein [Synergistales bacterium]|nr:secretion system protein [Synergistales bacterium]